MKLSHLEAFVMVADLSSFSAAARALGIEPSAVSRRVSALESDLNVKLLHRTTRQLSVTEAGVELLQRGRPALSALQEVANDLQTADAAPRGRIRLAVPGAIGRRLVSAPVFGFLALYPEISVDLRVSDARIDLVAEGIDLALRMGSAGDPRFVTRVIGRSPQVIVASEDYIARYGAPVSLAALASCRRVLRRQLGGVEDVSGPDPIPPVLICDDVETTARAVVAGVGVGMLPEWLVAQLPSLRRLPITLPRPPAPVMAVLPGGRRPPRRVRLLLEHLAASIEWGGLTQR